jgi:CHAT domain-containing protein
MAEFYRQLAAGRNKAEALRGAQLLALNDARYAHPAYWAPFLLIGEWR